VYWPLGESRFRNRFEPSGAERRRLRRAMAISRMCQRARHARLRTDRKVSDLTQWAWRAWMYWSCFAGRKYFAGWLTHYNAACFYALLPQADQPGAPFGDERVRKVALDHLRRAIRQAGGALSYAYVHEEDRDLDVLRSPGNLPAFERAIAPLARTS
jgi:hypothetical protein